MHGAKERVHSVLEPDSYFRSMRIAFVIMTLSLVGSLLFGYAQYQKAARWTGVNVDHDYDLARDITILRLKADGRLLDVGYDRNQDLENDSLVSYAANGQISFVYVDEDFNGIYEVNYAFDLNGELVAKSEDIGQDGYFNECTRYTPDSIFVYRDANGDQWYDEDELIRKSAK
jgi:hypothetical protein